jgi:hypothetical protein
MRAIWRKYPDEYGYRSEKIEEIDSTTLMESGYRLVQMFDATNRELLRRLMDVLNIPIPDEWTDIPS